MEVHVESAGGLSRRLHVKIPYERVERELGLKLKQLASRARIPGFRPGKAPLKVVRQQYGDSARMDVIGELVRESWPQALSQVGVAPAGAPNFEITSEKAGEPLAYVASFDVYPEITLDRLDTLAVTRPAVDVSEADVERLIDNLRKSRRTVETVERAASAGDIAVVDFDGKLDGEDFAGGKGERIEIELGEKQFLPDLENAILGHSAGESFKVDVHFPADYRAENLRGKTAQFDVQLLEVREPRLPQIDGEFLKAHGVDETAGIEALRAKCRAALEAERDKAIRTRLKKDVLDQLLAAHPIEVPAGQVQQEVERLREETAQRMGLNQNPAQARNRLTPQKTAEMLPAALFEAAAQRRVALGLLIGEVIKTRNIQLDAGRVDRQLDEIAADYEQPEAIKQYYRSRPELMQSLRSVTLEEQVVESLLENARSTELKMTLEDLLKSQAQTPG
jgi:trigger factor